MAATNPHNERDLESNGVMKDNETYNSTILADFDSDQRFRKFANPAPLGLCGFALTTFVLSLINVEARSVTVPNIVIGLGTIP
jgi:succinate-acetate transporter protein